MSDKQEKQLDPSDKVIDIATRSFTIGFKMAFTLGQQLLAEHLLDQPVGTSSSDDLIDIKNGVKIWDGSWIPVEERFGA